MSGGLTRDPFPDYERTVPIGEHFRSRNSSEAVLLSIDLWSDRITLNFGSNTKAYVFVVTEIRPKGAGCLVLSDQSEGSEDRERLEVPSCSPAAEQSSEQK